jgi:hypothetical protein
MVVPGGLPPQLRQAKACVQITSGVFRMGDLERERVPCLKQSEVDK